MNRALVYTALMLTLFACGGGDDDKDPTGPGPNTGGNRMTAKIDGQAWTGSASVSGGLSVPGGGSLSITGTNLSPLVSVVLSLAYIDGPGAYPLGVNFQTNAGGLGSVIRQSENWLSPLSGAAGAVTITTRTNTRIAGTFFFTADKTPGSGAPLVVTDGEFDITKEAGLPALPTRKASTVIAEFDGTHWNGASISVQAGGVTFGATSTSYVMGIGLHTQPVEGHTYAIGPDASMSAERANNNDSWLSATQDSVGYVTISSVTTERIEGVFAGHLAPAGTATAPLVVTNGTFSLHLP